MADAPPTASGMRSRYTDHGAAGRRHTDGSGDNGNSGTGGERRKHGCRTDPGGGRDRYRGREVVRQLAAHGARVRAFVRDEQRGRRILGRFKVEYAVGDLAAPASVARAARGCAGLFLLTQDGPRQVGHAVGAARAGADAGVGHIAVLSSSSSAPDAPFSWSRDHHAIERQVETLGIGYSHLRPHYFMQNLFDVLHIEADAAVLRLPMASGRLSAIDVRDVAACAAAVLTGAPLGRAAVLTGGASFSLQETASVLSAHCGLTVRYADEDPAAHLDAMLSGGIDRSDAESIALMYEWGRAGNSTSSPAKCRP